MTVDSSVRIRKKIQKIIIPVLFGLPACCFAQMDPFTNAGQTMNDILFGTLGTVLCSIIIGATFIMAKAGKVSWDKFLFIGFCTAGFLGAPSIVSLLRNAVG